MGCGCKTNKQISYLQKKYGEKVPQSKSTRMRKMFLGSIKNILLIILMIPVVPIFLIFTGIKHIFSKKPIDINKTFKIKK